MALIEKKKLEFDIENKQRLINMRELILTTLVSELENCDNDNGVICFNTRNINTEKNNRVVLTYYEVLRKMYKLSPKTRKPQKFTSQTLLQISRSLNYDIQRKSKYVKSAKGTGTSYGIYNININ